MTNPSTDPETLRARAAEIARGLSEAQRKFLCQLSGEWSVLARPLDGQVIWLPPSLLEQATPLRIGTERLRLTPLGLAVREYLQGNPHDD